MHDLAKFSDSGTEAGAGGSTTSAANSVNGVQRDRSILARVGSLRRNAGLALALVLVVSMLVGPAMGPVAYSLSREQTGRALLASVQIIVPDDTLDVISFGSGTVMNESGLILTNHHVVAGDAPNGLMNDVGLALIAVAPEDLRGESIIKFVGTIVKIDPVLDLALIQIDGLFDDLDVPLPADLGLTSIELGDSDELMISDSINVFGYPGIGGNTPTLTRGTVSGFLDDDRDGIYEWIKTDAVLSNGNSGGLATDELGRFVGVPTAGRLLDASQIGLVRSGNLALEFVNSYFPQADANQPSITGMQFASGVNRRNEPVNPAVRFAGGTTDLYAVFAHRNFQNGRSLTAIWRMEGMAETRETFVWDGGQNGSNWVSLYVEGGLPEGFLQLELLFDGTTVYRGGVPVGDSPAPALETTAARFGPITFAEGAAGSRPINPGTAFSNLDMVYALFDFADMARGLPWNTRWYLNGSQVLESFEIWNDEQAGTYFVTLSHPDGLPQGLFRLELYIDGILAQSGEFQMSAAEQPAAREVGVTGTLLDRDNQRRPVNGASIVVLAPTVSASDWMAEGMPASGVIARGTSNRQGLFRLDSRLVAGERYSIVVTHNHYRMIAVDGHLIPQDAPDPYRLDLNLQRN
jgi:S1-C subfamily serine protease